MNFTFSHAFYAVVLSAGLICTAACSSPSPPPKEAPPTPQTAQTPPAQDPTPQKTPPKDAPSTPSDTPNEPPLPSDLEGQIEGEATCEGSVATTLHCALEGTDPNARRSITCCRSSCMGTLAEPSEDAQKRISLRDESSQQPLDIDVRIVREGACLQIEAKEPIAADTHVQLTLPRFALRTTHGDTVSFNNALETLGAWHTCFHPQESFADRNTRENDRNMCKDQRARIAARPVFLDQAKTIAVRRSYTTRRDQYSDIKRFSRDAFDIATRTPMGDVPTAQGPAVLSMVFKDASSTALGQAELRCDGWLCFQNPADPSASACYRAHAPTINAFFRLESRGCNP